MVEAFLAASRAGDFQALVAVLDPEVVLRADGGAAAGLSGLVQGAAEVARRALGFARLAPLAQQVQVNGAAGLLVVRDAAPIAVLGFTIRRGRIVEIHVVADRVRLRRILAATGP